jgi:predicted metallopeptidase
MVLLSGHDLRRLLNPKVVIEALREAYARLPTTERIRAARLPS